MNVATLLQNAAQSEGERTAVAVGTQRHLTYAELATRVASLARGLREQFGLQPGDRVGIAMPNSPQYLECLFACWHGGFVAVPINAKLHARETAYIIGHAGATLAFTDAAHHDALAAALASDGSACRLQVVGDAAYDALFRDAGEPAAEVAPDDVAWLFYTSGTTGRPKGAMLSHRNLIAMTLNYYADMEPVDPGDAVICAAPLSHGAGLYVLPFVAKGGVAVLPESGGFEAPEIFALVQAYPNASFFAVPTMVVRLTASALEHAPDTRNLKTIVYGGGPMYVADMERAIGVFGPKFTQLFGQGESPMTITGLSRAAHADVAHPRWRERLGTVGITRIGCEVRVVDAGDRPVPAGKSGEVIVRGDVVMAGYWNDPAATAKALRGGWLHTGDIGAFNDEGYLTLKDRAKDMIISGGTNIYPREVEEVLLQHPAVREASVVGRPNPEWGEDVVAFVVRAPDASCDADELGAFCLDHVARFKRPKEIFFVDALPKNNYGKVLKTELRARLEKA